MVIKIDTREQANRAADYARAALPGVVHTSCLDPLGLVSSNRLAEIIEATWAIAQAMVEAEDTIRADVELAEAGKDEQRRF